MKKINVWKRRKKLHENVFESDMKKEMHCESALKMLFSEPWLDDWYLKIRKTNEHMKLTQYYTPHFKTTSTNMTGEIVVFRTKTVQAQGKRSQDRCSPPSGTLSRICHLGWNSGMWEPCRMSRRASPPLRGATLFSIRNVIMSLCHHIIMLSYTQHPTPYTFRISVFLILLISAPLSSCCGSNTRT